MGVVFTNNAETTLAAAITSTSATSISVTSSSTFPAIQAGEHFYATLDDGTNNEIVKVTGVSGTTWTVVRASDSTTARTFANGITVQLRATAALLTDIQENIAAKSANQTVYNATAASNATAYDVGVNPGVEANAMVFLDGVMQHHDTFSFSGSTLTFDAAPTNGTKIEVIVDNLINLQSSNLTTDTFTATSGQTAFTLSDAPAAENNLIVFIDGVFQDQGNYSISNHTLTLATGAVVGRTVTVYIINPVNIGTPSDGTVTSAKLSGNITMPGTLTVGAFDVAFDSPTFFVDNANSRVGLGTSTPSVPVDIVGEVKISSHLNMPDNAKAKFGTGSDLQIYHDGSNSWIKDEGTGVLAITTNGNGIGFYDSAGAEPMLFATKDNSVDLYFNGSKKLGTTNTGIDVTGVITQQTPANTDSILTVDSTSTNVSQRLNLSANGTIQTQLYDDASQTKLFAVTNKPLLLGTNNTTAITIDTSQNVGIGTTSPTRKLSISGTGSEYINIVGGTTSGVGLLLGDSDAEIRGAVIYDNASDALGFRTGGNTERVRINHQGNISFGAQKQDPTISQFFNGITGNYGSGLSMQNNGYAVLGLCNNFFINSSTQNQRVLAQPTQQLQLDHLGNFLFQTAASGTAGGTFSFSEKMRLDVNGNLLVGTTSIGNASTNAKICGDSEFLSRGSAAGFFWENRTGMTIASQSGWGGWYSTGSSVHYLYSDGANRASIGRTSGTYTALSDVNKKKDFEDSTVGLAEVMQLKPKKFRMLEDADDAPKKLGFVAQDVENVIPEAYVEDLADDENEETFIGLTDRPIIAALTKAIQEQQTIIDDLKTRIEALEG